jgi:FAD dependent oxidoreductase TIGR03364
MEVAIVGAGILGLSHAWSAAERGCRVTVFERSPRAAGASIRNFGMAWPIGQAASAWHAVALASRERWLRLGKEAGIRALPCGSIHLAHRDDEWRVLEEFVERAPEHGVKCELLDSKETLLRTAAANREGLRGGLFSPTEVSVDPPGAIRTLPRWLSERYGVRFRFGTAVAAVEAQAIVCADGTRAKSDRTIVCGGAETAALFPELIAAARMRRCKLQMLRTTPQPAGWELGPHLASGLTLRHYRNFEICPSLEALKKRVASETPELDRFGIHVMASQVTDGSVILGDSHEYDEAIEPFDKAEIDALMLRELLRAFSLPDWTIAARWHGEYLKCDDAPIFAAEPEPGVFVRTGLGGSGMTMSPGLAEQDWKAWS